MSVYACLSIFSATMHVMTEQVKPQIVILMTAELCNIKKQDKYGSNENRLENDITLNKEVLIGHLT